MSDEIPPELQTTIDMIRRAFPDGVSSQAYLPLLSSLYDHMSDRNLAIVASAIFGQPYEKSLNDIYRVGGDPGQLDPNDVAQILKRLQSCGFEQWLNEAP